MSQRILVTGAGGFIGSHLVQHLKQLGSWVRAVDTAPATGLAACADEVLARDFRRYEDCLAATYEIDAVYHLAADTGGLGYRSKQIAVPVRNNTIINANLLEACRAHRVSRFLFASSASVYPFQMQKGINGAVFQEQDAFPAQPEEGLGWEKLFAEKLCSYYQTDFGLEIRIARCNGVYGPHSQFAGGREFSLAALCREVALAPDGGSIVVWGDGKQLRSYLYIDDCVDGLVRIMQAEDSNPFNLGSEEYVSLNDLADKICAIANKKLIRKNDPAQRQGARSRKVDMSRLKNVLAWSPQTRLEQGLRKTYEWIDHQVHDKPEIKLPQRDHPRHKAARVRAISRSVTTHSRERRSKVTDKKSA